MAGLTAVFILIAAPIISLGVAVASPALVCLGLAALSLLVVIRLRLQAVLTPDSLLYTGLVGTKRVTFSEIVFFARSADTSYVASRFFGAFVYEVRTQSEVVRINLKLFPAELGQQLFAALEARGLTSG